MNPYILALGLALAGEVEAEEPKECIDKLVLSVEVKPSVGNFVDQAMTDEVLTGVRYFYKREVGLNVFWGYSSNRTPGDIHVSFGTVNDCVKEWYSDVEAYYSQSLIGIQDETKRKKVELMLEKFRKLPPDAKIRNNQELMEGMWTELIPYVGLSNPPIREVYVFPEQVYRRSIYISTDMRSAANNLLAWAPAHELGHILGLDHAIEMYVSMGGYNIMYDSTMNLIKQNRFSEADKQKIQLQMCRPEEQQ